MPTTELTNRLTPASINTEAKLKATILGQSHWFDGLRICENTIEEKQEALELAEIGIQELEGKILIRESEITDKTDPIKKLEISSDVKRLSISVRQHNRMKRDAEHELKIARELKEYLLALHPEVKDLSYERIQESLSMEAYLDNQVTGIVAAMLERQTHVPAHIIELLLKKEEAVINNILALIEPKLCQLDQSLTPLVAKFNPQVKQGHITPGMTAEFKQIRALIKDSRTNNRI